MPVAVIKLIKVASGGLLVVTGVAETLTLVNQVKELKARRDVKDLLKKYDRIIEENEELKVRLEAIESVLVYEDEE